MKIEYVCLRNPEDKEVSDYLSEGWRLHSVSVIQAHIGLPDMRYHMILDNTLSTDAVLKGGF